VDLSSGRSLRHRRLLWALLPPQPTPWPNARCRRRSSIASRTGSYINNQ
jgi:hypothetical protein